MKKSSDKVKEVVTIIVYAVITFCCVYFHEQWKDEAQSWLLAKNLNFVELINQMKYEGHPLLWYIIIMPFAKLRFSIFYSKNNKLDNNFSFCNYYYEKSSI